jgi:hypothetical protein
VQYRGAIEVLVFGQKMDNPYLGTLTIENAGRYDIDSTLFDQGRPLRFEVKQAKKVGTFLDQSDNPPGLRVDGNSIFIGPELLHAKSEWTISFISDGRPEINLADSHLVNVEIREKLTAGQAGARSSNFRSSAVVTSVIVALIGAAAVITAAIINASIH